MDGGQALRGGPLTIVVGELLLVVCSLCYLAWWIITFRPAARSPRGGGLLLSGAVLAGLGGIVLLAVGIAVLIPRASTVAAVGTIAGGAIVGALLVSLTVGVAHRPLTTELPLIVVWGTAQLAAGVTLRTAGELTAATATGWVATTTIATVVGLVCYLVFYRLDPVLGYRIGMVPLAVDGAAAVVLALMVTVGRVR